ncbi:zinc ribbon domain-containing protein [Cardinium endosymbiont of Oedothorax gibbosus]|uniref:zinc ribbon domain-containing protein n=1 Tax=Cardinium endosymbiont of Oedothorax gibbosus TaxID=931101 RepID=UPI002023CC4E|nr:C4-type zinc ribbon domain-containing protein [Cardinium endosymbiont of Oedothorax gibbosus]CAH2559615.1 Putative phospholipase c-beta-2-related family protein [Cardinium endosymbiont of Oedothorax gibbosus]
MDKDIAIKLTKLSELQETDTHLNDIFKLRGTLPEEVCALEAHIETLSATIQERESLLIALRGEVASKESFIKQAEKKFQQYEAQQMEVRNNREYDAITKELELHKLDIQLAEKFLHTAYGNIEHKQANLEELCKLLESKEADLVLKKEELQVILKSSEAEECALHEKRKAIIAVLGEPLYLAYERIRNNVSNNLAVVPVKKGACGGCCIVIPPQQKIGVYERNKIVLCEHCGRMLIALEQPIDALLFVR